MKTHRPTDPFTGAKPRPAESVPAHETKPEEITGPAPTGDKARALHLVGVEGMGYAAAAREIKRAQPTVYSWCKTAGVTPGSRRAEGAAQTSLDKALQPTTARGREPKLTVEEQVSVIHDINGVAAAASSAVDKFLASIPPAEADAPTLPAGVELPPVVVTVRQNGEPDDWSAHDLPPWSARSKGVACRRCGLSWYPGIASIGECRPAAAPGTDRGGQLPELPPLPAPQHVEVYVGPSRAARVEALEAERAAALRALRRSMKAMDWNLVELAMQILGGAS